MAFPDNPYQVRTVVKETLERARQPQAATQSTAASTSPPPLATVVDVPPAPQPAAPSAAARSGGGRAVAAAQGLGWNPATTMAHKSLFLVAWTLHDMDEACRAAALVCLLSLSGSILADDGRGS